MWLLLAIFSGNVCLKETATSNTWYLLTPSYDTDSMQEGLPVRYGYTDNASQHGTAYITLSVAI